MILNITFILILVLHCLCVLTFASWSFTGPLPISLTHCYWVSNQIEAFVAIVYYFPVEHGVCHFL